MKIKKEGKVEVHITLEKYSRLLDAEKFLICLHQAGVDSWDGYEQAQALYEMKDK